MTERIKITALSDRAHKSRGATRAILDAAGIGADAAGFYPLDAALKALEAASSPDKSLGRRAAMGSDEAPSSVQSLAAARARSETARAIKLELENKRLEGDLMSRETVVEAGKHFAAHVRAGLMSFGASVAPRLVGLSAAQIAAEIEAATRDLLARLGNAEDFIFEQTTGI